MEKKSIDISLIKKIFETMDYNTEELEECERSKVWLETNECKLPHNEEEIEIIFNETQIVATKWAALTPSKKFDLFNKLAAEIDNNSELISELELKSRGILKRDTKNKSIALFIDYLNYYAGWFQINPKYFSDYKPYGVCICILEEDTPLYLIGAVLSAALAANNVIVFEVKAFLQNIAFLLKQLCKKVGFPDGAVSFILTDGPKIHKEFKKITCIGNMEMENSNLTGNSEINMSAMVLSKATSIIFESADIESACDSIIESAYKLNAKFPYGIEQIYVQENIYENVVDLLEKKINKVNIQNSDDKNIKTCTDMLIKSFDPTKQKDNLLKIGNKKYGKNIIENFEITNNLFVNSFRTVNEGIQLANHSKFGLAMSIWTENVSVVHEVTSKLKAGVIWVNTHGYLNASAPFSPLKSSGTGYFGGKEGLLEYMSSTKKINFEATSLKVGNIENLSAEAEKKFVLYYGGSFKKYANKKDVKNCVETGKKSFEVWSKKSSRIRSQCLIKIATLSETLKKNHLPKAEKWIQYLRDWSTLCNETETLIQQGNPELKIVKEPLGFIVIEMYYDSDCTCLKLIAAALANGNAFVILNYSEEMSNFLEDLCKIMSSSGLNVGVFSVIFNHDIDAFNTLLSHKDIQTYFYSGDVHKNVDLPLKHLLRVKNIDNINFESDKDILNLVTKNKLIWTSVGDSVL